MKKLVVVALALSAVPAFATKNGDRGVKITPPAPTAKTSTAPSPAPAPSTTNVSRAERWERFDRRAAGERLRVPRVEHHTPELKR